MKKKYFIPFGFFINFIWFLSNLFYRKYGALQFCNVTYTAKVDVTSTLVTLILSDTDNRYLAFGFGIQSIKAMIFPRQLTFQNGTVVCIWLELHLIVAHKPSVL